LGEFSPFGRIFAFGAIAFFGQFFIDRSSPNVWAAFVHGKNYALISTKKWLGHILGDFLTNSYGHPGRIKFFFVLTEN
jgi:hypothetical protein